MRTYIRASATAATMLLIAQTASAQTCLGRPYFSTGPVQVGINTSVGGRVAAIGGELAVGKHNAFFGLGRVSQTRFERELVAVGNDPEGPNVELHGGYQVSFGSEIPSQFCPMVRAEWGRLDVAEGQDLRRSEVMVGGTIGWAPRPGTGVHVVPFVGAGIAYLDRTLERAGTRDLEFNSQTYYPITAGLGIHFERSLAIIGDLTIPANLTRGEPGFGIRMVVPTGGRR